MRKIIFSAVCLSILLADGPAFAQCGLTWRGSGGWGASTEYGRLFNPDTMETVSGRILRIDKMTPGSNMQQGAYLLLETKKGNRIVHLGPVWWVENQDVHLNTKEQVEVTGSRVMVNDKPVIIASEIKRGEDILRLRDERGRAAWNAWRRG
jgi:hypothetical protein